MSDTNESSNQEPVTEEPAAEEPATEEPAAEEPATEEPVAEEPTAEEPAAEEPAAEEPAAEEPAAEEPAAEEPTAEEPAAEEPAAEEPAAEDVFNFLDDSDSDSDFDTDSDDEDIEECNGSWKDSAVDIEYIRNGWLEAKLRKIDGSHTHDIWAYNPRYNYDNNDGNLQIDLPGSWKHSARNVVQIDNNTISCELRDMDGNWQQRELTFEDGRGYGNNNGNFVHE